MSRKNKTILAAALVASGIVFPVASSAQQTSSITSYQIEYGDTLPPIGHVKFCRARPAECRGGTTSGVIKLDRSQWATLDAVNRSVNQHIAPVSDQLAFGTDEHWTYPVGQGDCEDFVLLKRLMLIERGWPAGALLITVVRDGNGEGHAVLTAMTDRGEFVLDNKRDEILPPPATGYQFLKRQSRSHPARWVALDPTAQGERTRLFSGLGN